MRVLSIVGARPQFIKASAVSSCIGRVPGLSEQLLHTGQHFDNNMSDVFFSELGIPPPAFNLGIQGGSHGEMTAAMLSGVEKILFSENPDVVLVYGDTNSTLAGALAAAKLGIPLAHVEAGLRSFNMAMPEEINRILTDRISSTLYCPTQAAIENLEQEGVSRHGARVVYTGDVMLDAAITCAPLARPPSESVPEEFILATLHRAENTDNEKRLRSLVNVINTICADIPVVIPLHPRTRAALSRLDLQMKAYAIEPVGYLEILWLLKHCTLVLTDSGGLQKEAYFMERPCVTAREETEWLELVEMGVNVVAGVEEESLLHAVSSMRGKTVVRDPEAYGGGQAATIIARDLAGLH